MSWSITASSCFEDRRKLETAIGEQGGAVDVIDDSTQKFQFFKT
jgi:hypothetical protein